MKTKADFKKACEQFINAQKEDEDIIGIIVSGSYIHGTLHENSDIDIHLILDEKCEYRERGNTWVNGIEIEYFKNTPQQIRKYFVEEMKSPHTAHMLVHSSVEYNNALVVNELIEEARQVLAIQPKLMNDVQKELAKYHIDDQWKDYQDAVLNEDTFSRKFILFDLVNKLVDVSCQFYQLRRQKSKKLEEQLAFANADFEITLLIKNIFDSQNVEEEVKHLEKLKNHIENKIGGRRAKEWKLYEDFSTDSSPHL